MSSVRVPNIDLSGWIPGSGVVADGVRSFVKDKRNSLPGVGIVAEEGAAASAVARELPKDVARLSVQGLRTGAPSILTTAAQSVAPKAGIIAVTGVATIGVGVGGHYGKAAIDAYYDGQVHVQDAASAANVATHQQARADAETAAQLGVSPDNISKLLLQTTAPDANPGTRAGGPSGSALGDLGATFDKLLPVLLVGGLALAAVVLIRK
jgi:hypothetical protein